MSLVITLDLTSIASHDDLLATLRHVAEDIGAKLVCTSNLHVLAPNAHPVIFNEHGATIGNFYLTSHRPAQACTGASSDCDDHYGPDTASPAQSPPPAATNTL